MAGRVVATPDAPAAIGPYSQGLEVDGMVFVSGQIALDPATGKPVSGDIAVQTGQCLKNALAILKAAGCDPTDVVKTTIFLRDMASFPEVNRVYASYFPKDPPARSCVAVAGLPKDACIEIEMIAVKR